MKIAVVGTGYVGLSLAVLLSQKNEVVALDIDPKKIELINQRISPIEDKDINDFFDSKELNLTATLNKEIAYKDAKFIIVATPTNFDTLTNRFDTQSIYDVVNDVNKINPRSTIVIKSTIPLGFIADIKNKFSSLKIIFSPEFLREGSALYDNLHPSRIVIGDKSEEAQDFANLLLASAIKKDVDVLLTDAGEAESIKLFANSYLAMRVAFFNELDSYCLINKLNTTDIVKGISLDKRIGDYYNNPSFGYGGYCLPKDTKQLLMNYSNVPQSLIASIVSSNDIRKQFIASQILEKKPKVVGVYRLVMKHGSDNFRDAAIFDIMKILKDDGVELKVYEPTLNDNLDKSLFTLESNLAIFKNDSDMILANRLHGQLYDVKDKVFTRDIYTRD